MTAWHLAQLNVGRAVAPLDDPAMADFVDRLDEINTLGTLSPGFVWKLQGDGGTSVELHVTEDPQYVINLTVWESIDDLLRSPIDPTTRPCSSAASIGSNAARPPISASGGNRPARIRPSRRRIAASTC